MKILGSVLVLMAGYLLSIRLMEPSGERIRLLEEGEYLFRILESEIRNTKMPLPQLFQELGERTKTVWGDFFTELSGELQKRTDFLFADEFERLLTFYFSAVFSTEEKLLFLQVGRNLLSDDLLFHQDTARQLSEKIQTHVLQMKECVDKQKKVCQALCLSASGLLVIVLL